MPPVRNQITLRVSNLLPAAELLSHKLADVGNVVEGPQEPLQLQQLPVGRVIEPALDGDAVIDLVTKRVRAVVDQDHLLHVALTDVQVLEVVALHRQTGLAEYSVLDVLALRIDAIEQLVGVDLLAGGEDDDLELSVDSLKELLKIGALPYVDAVLDALNTTGKTISASDIGSTVQWTKVSSRSSTKAIGGTVLSFGGRQILCCGYGTTRWYVGRLLMKR